MRSAGIAFRIEGNARGNTGVALPRCDTCNPFCAEQISGVGDRAPRRMERDPRPGEGGPRRKECRIGCGEGDPEVKDSLPRREATSVCAGNLILTTWPVAATSGQRARGASHATTIASFCVGGGQSGRHEPVACCSKR
jgi:hypothetical protein